TLALLLQVGTLAPVTEPASRARALPEFHTQGMMDLHSKTPVHGDHVTARHDHAVAPAIQVRAREIAQVSIINLDREFIGQREPGDAAAVVNAPDDAAHR